eukprot:TRINITY_DN7838_c0_g1_i2.p1 TRINITY_DN7838_c0_g1~~TRINITY_DN7838_c0_g1_i2.p1  ORF type:complete len:446 (-),score=88.44 TRINITY_DN7838_c0_g1_i2:238-1575(-)
MTIQSKLQLPTSILNRRGIVWWPIVFLVLRWCWHRFRRSALQASSKPLPIVPSYAPLGIDTMVKLSSVYDHCLEQFEEWRRAYGNTHGLEMMGRTQVFVYEPASIQHFLAKNWENYEKGGVFRTVFHPLLGDGIFNVNGRQWSQHRQIARPHFQKVELLKMVPTFLHHANCLVDIIDPVADSSKVVDMQNYFFCLTLDGVGDILLGHNINSLAEPSKFATAFDSVQAETAWRGFVHPMWHLFSKSQYNKQLGFVDKFVQEIVDRSFVDPEISNRSDLLAEYIKGDPKPSRDYLVDMVKNMLIAGRDTTAVLLTWFFYEVSLHPQVRDKIHEEIDRVLGDSDPTSEKLEELKYLKNVLNETLRLHPSVPIDVRTSVKEDVLPNGYYIPPDSDVNYSAYITHRMEEYWGRDAHKFDPDRWEADRIRQVPSFAFVPFHAGFVHLLSQQ